MPEKVCPNTKCMVKDQLNCIYVGHRGKKGATYMIIGERGAVDECKVQKPFVGKSGQKLDEILTTVGIRREECFITNAVGCGHKKGASPTIGELEQCLDYVIAQIKTVKPKIIILMGGMALYPIYNTVTGIKKMHGRIEWNDEYNCWITSTYHPSSALRDEKGAVEWAIIKDLQRAKSLIDGKWEISYPNIIVHDTTESIIKYLNSLGDIEAFAFDTETNSIDVYTTNPKIACLSFSTSPDEGHVLWLKNIPTDEMPLVIREIKKLMESDKIKVGANLKYDNTFIRRTYSIVPKPPYFDVIIAHRLLYTCANEHGLKVMSLQFTKMGGYEEEIDEYKGADDGYYSVPKELLVEYSGRDAVATWCAYQNMDAAMRKERTLSYNSKGQKIVTSLTGIFDLSMDIMDMLSYVEELGIFVNMDIVNSLKEMYERKIKEKLDELHSYDEVQLAEVMAIIAEIEKKIATLQRKLGRLKGDAVINRTKLEIEELEEKRNEYNSLVVSDVARSKYFQGHDIKNVNIGSNPQMSNLLFNICDLTPTKRSKKTNKPSVDEGVLRSLDHPIATIIREYRHYTKMLGTYIANIEKDIDSSTGVIHPSFIVNGAISGRLTSGFHTLPSHGEDYIIKSMFVSSNPNGVIVAADFSQMELKVAASLSGDKRMITAMVNGEDLHRITAASIYNVPINEVTHDQRQVGKKINFGLIYSISPYGLINQGIAEDEDEGKHFIDTFFRLYPNIKRWMNHTKNVIGKIGASASPLGRFRDLRILLNQDPNKALRRGVNFPVQSVANDYALISTYKMYKWLIDNNKVSRIIGMVHDSVFIDTIPNETLDVILIFKKIAESGDLSPYFPKYKFRVPLEVGFKVGYSLYLPDTLELSREFFENPTENLTEHLQKAKKIQDDLFKS